MFSGVVEAVKHQTCAQEQHGIPILYLFICCVPTGQRIRAVDCSILREAERESAGVECPVTGGTAWLLHQRGAGQGKVSQRGKVKVKDGQRRRSVEDETQQEGMDLLHALLRRETAKRWHRIIQGKYSDRINCLLSSKLSEVIRILMLL